MIKNIHIAPCYPGWSSLIYKKLINTTTTAMDRFNLDYSLKNIPVPSRFKYEKEVAFRMQKFAKNLSFDHWARRTNQLNTHKPSFGLKSNSCVPLYNEAYEIKPFKEDLAKLISNIKYRPHTNEFQKRLKNDCNRIRNSSDIIVSADKTANLYKMPIAQYKNQLLNNITKDYMKVNINEVKNTNIEAKTLANKFNVARKAEILSDNPSFITIKDHKDDFPGRIKCRLINPSKTEIGKISKHILAKVNKEIKAKTSSNQWSSTKEALTWFKGLNNKQNLTFFQFDIESFYPSISETTLQQAINFAQQHTNINQDEIDIIMHSRQTFLFSGGEAWVKKKGQKFDVAMGSYDSAEVAELVGLYILNGLEKFIPQQNIGLYRDDGLGVTDCAGPDAERLRKRITKHFKELGFQITTNIRIKVVNFLDTTLNLDNGSHKPFRKETNPPCYINTKSCHPANVIKQLPNMIENRVSELSSNQTIFRAEKEMYDKALKASGYKHTLTYKQPQQTPNSLPKNRKRRVIWFNPPFNSAVKSNIAMEFLKLVDKHFPKNSPLHKYYNRNTLKVSYSTMANIGSIIQSHNKKLLGESNLLTEKGCNCRKPQECPLDGKCLTESVVYKALVTDETNQTKYQYIGLSSGPFKKRYYSHTHSFRHNSKNTKLSECISKLKEQNKPHSLKWSIKALATPYNQNLKKCQLCLTECVSIAHASRSTTTSLNMRNEIFNHCIHRKKYLLDPT